MKTQIVTNRRQGRELVLQALYAHKFTSASISTLIENLKRYAVIDADVEKYLTKLLSLSVKHRKWSENIIEERVKNWEFERVALMDRLILQMMLTEMVYMDEVPPKVSITEGIEIAKKYSTKDSGAFVNGILDSIYHSLSSLNLEPE